MPQPTLEVRTCTAHTDPPKKNPGYAPEFIIPVLTLCTKQMTWGIRGKSSL